MISNMETTKTILAIDDDPNMLKLLQLTLEQEGYDVLLAADGVYGAQLVQDGAPDLVLLDITMPGPDGYQVIRSIKENCSVPIIMITGMHSAESFQRCLESGADDFVAKPFRPGELVVRIKARLEHANNQAARA